MSHTWPAGCHCKGASAALTERSTAAALLGNEEVQVKSDLSDGTLLWIYNNRGGEGNINLKVHLMVP